MPIFSYFSRQGNKGVKQLEVFALHSGAPTIRNTLDQVHLYVRTKLWQSLIYPTFYLSAPNFWSVIFVGPLSLILPNLKKDGERKENAFQLQRCVCTLPTVFPQSYGYHSRCPPRSVPKSLSKTPNTQRTTPGAVRDSQIFRIRYTKFDPSS